MLKIDDDDDFTSLITQIIVTMKQMEEETQSKNRLGMAEPYFHIINYLHDVLSTNFPDDRTLCNLQHYFSIDNEKLCVLFDISYFKGFNPPYQFPFYNSDSFDGLTPTMVINVVSSSTYNDYLGLTAQICQKLGIPIYVFFSNHISNPAIVKAPYLKVIYLDNGNYHIADLSEVCCTEGKGYINHKRLIDIRPDILPFKFGIMKLQDKYRINNKDYATYRLVLIDRNTKKILKTKAEKSQMEAEEAIRKAEKKASEKLKRKMKEMEEKVKRETEKIRKLEKKLKEKEKEAEAEKNRADGAERKAQKAEKKLQRLKDVS